MLYKNLFLITFILFQSANFSYAQEKIIKTENDLLSVKETTENYKITAIGDIKLDSSKMGWNIHIGKEFFPFLDGGDIRKYEGKRVEIKGYLKYISNDEVKRQLSTIRGDRHWITKIYSISDKLLIEGVFEDAGYKIGTCFRTESECIPIANEIVSDLNLNKYAGKHVALIGSIDYLDEIRQVSPRSWITSIESISEIVK